MKCRLDIIDSESWPTEAVNVVRNKLKSFGGDEESINKISSKLVNRDDDEVTLFFKTQVREIVNHISGFVAYHCCRPLSVQSYRDHGLLVRTDERLRAFAQKYVGDVSGWETACDEVLALYHGPYRNHWYDNTAGLGFVPFESYAKSGSYFLCGIFERLGAMGKERKRELFENTKPVSIKCELPRAWVVGDETDGDLLGSYVEELLLSIIAHECGREREIFNPSAIHLLVDLPPDNILEIRCLNA
ncbi:hypothetical protein [Pontiella sulfatireligans]|uniref:Uncharacterized protein n=1 Tax=Pontiella sulfatireligans TaxID=2750658 RepID=A0A6C2UIE9_9BACT|nr:hypothetical protein [Pontiella sulfatireligans]VGO19970.1 hypothetical protein SCARR_02030 [Pontiella sulfatireligans]